MTNSWMLQNLLSYFLQLALLVLAAGVLARVLRVRLPGFLAGGLAGLSAAARPSALAAAAGAVLREPGSRTGRSSG